MMAVKLDYKCTVPGYEDCVFKVDCNWDGKVSFHAYLPGEEHSSFKEAATLEKLVEGLTALAKKKIKPIPVMQATGYGNLFSRSGGIKYGKITSNPDPNTVWVMWHTENGKKISGREKLDLKAETGYRSTANLLLDTPENRAMAEEYVANTKRLHVELDKVEKAFASAGLKFDKSLIQEVEEK